MVFTEICTGFVTAIFVCLYGYIYIFKPYFLRESNSCSMGRLIEKHPTIHHFRHGHVHLVMLCWSVFTLPLWGTASQKLQKIGCHGGSVMSFGFTLDGCSFQEREHLCQDHTAACVYCYSGNMINPLVMQTLIHIITFHYNTLSGNLLISLHIHRGSPRRAGIRADKGENDRAGRLPGVDVCPVSVESHSCHGVCLEGCPCPCLEDEVQCKYNHSIMLHE